MSIYSYRAKLQTKEGVMALTGMIQDQTRPQIIANGQAQFEVQVPIYRVRVHVLDRGFLVEWARA